MEIYDCGWHSILSHLNPVVSAPKRESEKFPPQMKSENKKKKKERKEKKEQKKEEKKKTKEEKKKTKEQKEENEEEKRRTHVTNLKYSSQPLEG
ncbi:hypothetical protein M8J75_011940 [Diaphorina citri]|nr:hypothetical protein M8J75_011940 [Diaphorina citri]